ncbi:MAG TPA: tetratricopeptide repeat protein, partial [Bryobacterales bacterium]|nr:tetratricopeptide repeat protein [Bryobacterales bacterium]
MATPTPVLREASSAIVPAGHVFLAENHDYAYYLWRERGIKDRILVHVDAHHDLWWIPEKGSPSIANFLCQALRENQVRELVWVVPDPTWESRRSRRPLLSHLKELARKYPGGQQPVEVTEDAISTVLLGKPLRICPLATLPKFAEDVLLDIDTDFFVIPRVSFRDWDTHSQLPWCWPEELVTRLGAAGLQAEMATIVYSVEGGYTPLKWKYLGDEMALRLRDARDEETMRGMRLLREAAVAAHHGEPTAAEQLYQQAEQLLPASAAPPFHLAQLYVETGRLDEARSFYRKALAIDPSYRTPYN